MENELYTRIVKHNTEYAYQRKFAYRKLGKKVSLETMANEIIIGRTLGELSGAEKILQAIVDNKDWDREMIEAELHIFVEKLAEVGSLYLQGKKTIELEDILKMYGYFGKEAQEQTCQ